MPEYLIHKNGRGKLYDDAEANRATFIDKTSSASGNAKLRDCRLTVNSEAQGDCQIYGGRFTQTFIQGATVIAGNPEIVDSIVDCSEISGTPYIEASDLTGLTEVCDSPIIIGAGLHDAIVYGSPRVDGARYVSGRIHEGTWTRAPKHIKLPWCDLSECINGKMLLDCYCRPVEWWLRFGPRIAKKWDWNQDQIDVTLATIDREFLVSKRVAA